MNPAAQNALLKTLEEPQEDTVFVLLSEREEELLETIRSRCRVVRLEPVSQRRLVELLVSDGVDHPDALLAARLSEGDLGRARALACDGEVRARRTLWSSIPGRLTTPVASLEAAGAIVEAARAAVKERERAQKIEVAELAEALGEGRGTSVARNALAKRHKRELRRVEEQVLGEALGFLGSFYRDVVALRAGGDEAVTHLDLVAELGGWAASETPDAGFIRAAERCIEARTSLVRNANPALAIEAALVELSSLAEPRAPWPAAPPG
jgi:DNA polymerase-3 subunit delta'